MYEVSFRSSFSFRINFTVTVGCGGCGGKQKMKPEEVFEGERPFSFDLFSVHPLRDTANVGGGRYFSVL